VALLARHFVAEVCTRDGLGRKTLTPAAVRKLEGYSWPGNVRELHNAIHRAVLCTAGAEILPRHLTLGGEYSQPSQPDTEAKLAADTFQVSKRRAIESFERTYVQDLLHTFSGNISRAAREAGKDRRAFGRLARKYGLTQPHA
jgi:DNA-binding NtrC family response regulator